MRRRALAWLIAGAVAATACYFLVARPPGPNAYLIFYLGTPAVAVALMTLPGDRLSIVMMVLPLSLPSCAFVLVQSLIWADSA